jgi:O-antigen biosynthesis protein
MSQLLHLGKLLRSCRRFFKVWLQKNWLCAFTNYGRLFFNVFREKNTLCALTNYSRLFFRIIITFLRRIITFLRRIITFLRRIITFPIFPARHTVSGMLREVFARKNFGVFGMLEIPNDRDDLLGAAICVSGWALSSESSIIKITATVNGKETTDLSYGLQRDDVLSNYPNFSGSGTCGYTGFVRLEETGGNTIKILVRMELENGKSITVGSRKIRRKTSPKTRSRINVFCLDLYALFKKGYFLYRTNQLPKSSILWSLAIRKSLRLLSQSHRQVDNYLLSSVSDSRDPYSNWIETNRISRKLESLMVSEGNYLSDSCHTVISIVVPVYNPPAEFLEQLISSITAQYYRNWELVLVDDASTASYVRPILERAAKLDLRVKVAFRSENGHICRATNDGFDLAVGDFVALVDHDDLLPKDALLSVMQSIIKFPNVDWIYTDEDKIDSTGRRYDPQFKGKWNPEMAITHNYTHHLTVVRTSVLQEAKGMRVGFEGAQDLDLFLRLAELVDSKNIKHISKICYHWRSHDESTASSGKQKTYIFDSAEQAIKEALLRRGLDAEPFLPPIAKKFEMCLNQLRWNVVCDNENAVTVLIPTKDRVDLLRRCIESVCRTCNLDWIKLIVIDDRSTEPETLSYFRELEASKKFDCKVVRPSVQSCNFNYARLINEGVKYVETPYFLQLNNDIAAKDEGWLEDMVGWLCVPGVEVVGARLVYPDSRLQHAGVVVGPYGGLADHQFHQLHEDEVGYLALPHAARNVTAVTGACMLSSIKCFNNLKGFDDENFSVEYNDVDFCLKVVGSGGRIVYTPQATLEHVTSASRGSSYNPLEHSYFVSKYKGFKDPFYNENLSKENMTMPVRADNFSHKGSVKGIRILLISHNFTLTGAPLVALEFAKQYKANENIEVTVLTLEDGDVGELYKESGIKVLVIEGIAINLVRSKGFEEMLEKINTIDVANTFDLVVCNSLAAFWGVLLANKNGIPSILHVHESTGVESYSRTFLDISMRELINRAFLTANRVVFQAEATRHNYIELEDNRNFLTSPGGVPLSKIVDFKKSNNKADLRTRYGLSKDEIIVSIIGTTCERKGQEVFLRAVDVLIANKKLQNNVKFLIVGAVDGPYLSMLRKMIHDMDLSSVQLVEETPGIYDYFAMSDIFVCASYQESFPMVVLLAMAFQLPIISTGVYGVPEIITHNHDAILVPPGDPIALSAAISNLLEQPETASLFAARAYAKVCRLFDSQDQYERNIELVAKVAMEESFGGP